MPQQPSPERSPIPMESLSSPCLEKHSKYTNPDVVPSSPPPSMSAVSPANTSLVITIVTSEEVPGVDTSRATTTIDRELKLRLTLPPNYDMKRLKSFNVTLQQDNSHWQQQQLRLFEEQRCQQEAVPAPVMSSKDVISSTPSSFDDASPPLPEVVPSSSGASHEKKRRRTITTPTPPSSSTSTAQTSSRKKRKRINKKEKNPAQ